MMKTLRTIAVLLILLLSGLWIPVTMAVAVGRTTPPPCFSAIYSFGDSLADTGNLLLSDRLARSIVGRPPYGTTYFHRPTGRFSDGRLIVDFFAQANGLPLLQPYLRVKENKVNINSGGVNFAVAGATSLSSDGLARVHIEHRGTPFSLGVQIGWFLDYKKAFCAVFSRENPGKNCDKDHFQKALFMFGEIGGNDFNNQFLSGKSITQVQWSVKPVMHQTMASLRYLIEQGGATHLMVQNNLPIGCSPAYLTIFSDAEKPDATGCMPRFNTFAQSANALYRRRVADLQNQFGRKNVRIIFADYYQAAMRIIQAPSSFGMKEVTRACCGASPVNSPYNYDGAQPCGKSAIANANACSNPNEYFNWDGIHLTEAAYSHIASLFLAGSFTAPPFHTLQCPNRSS